MNFQLLLTEISENILTITINRPEKLNALNQQVLKELDEAFDEVEFNEEVHGIIVTGAGPKAFIAGADISEFSNYNSAKARQMSENGNRIFNKIESCSRPVIAAVNGFALGGGCELAMACHMRIASENAKFGSPEINLGIIPGYGGTQRLPRYIGKGKALELLLTADTITAQEALQLGLVNYVTTKEELLPKCVSILNKIKTKPPLVVDRIIACVNAYYEKPQDGFEMEIDEFARSCDGEDFREGTAAFLEKRMPNFKGK